jgi:hypothetical protein
MARRRPISTGTASAGLVATLALVALAVRSPAVAPLLAGAACWLGGTTWLHWRLGTSKVQTSLHDQLHVSLAGFATQSRAHLAGQQRTGAVELVLDQLDEADGPTPVLLPFRPHVDLRTFAADELAAQYPPLRRRTATGWTIAAELVHANLVFPVLADVPVRKVRRLPEILGAVLACVAAVGVTAWLETAWRIEPSTYHRSITLALGLGLMCLLPLLEIVLATSSGRRWRIAAIVLTPLVFMAFWNYRAALDAQWWQPAFGLREWLVVGAVTAIALGVLGRTSSTRVRNRLPARQVGWLSWAAIASIAVGALGLVIPVLAGPPPTAEFQHVAACSLLSRDALARIAPNIDVGPANTFTESSVNGCEWYQGHGPLPIEFVAIDAYVGNGDVQQSVREFTLAANAIAGAPHTFAGPCDQATEVRTDRGVEVVLRCGNLVLTVFSSAADPKLVEALAAEAVRVATGG